MTRNVTIQPVASSVGKSSNSSLEVETSLKALIVQLTNSTMNELQSDTTLQKLGLDGDDADEFIQEYAQRFQVDMTEFVFSKHFGPEASFNPIVLVISRVFRRKWLDVEPITIARLIQAAIDKKWRDLVAQQDPLGRVMRYFVDTAGRRRV